MANVEAGNEQQMTIKSLVESYGLVITSSKLPGAICAISALEFIYEKYGFHTLNRTLRLCVGTWEGDPNSLTSNMLKGIARLVIAYGDSMRDDLFKEKVGAYSAREISRTAKERKAGSLGYAEALLLAYNRRMKGGLKWNKLYTNKNDMPEDMDLEEETEEFNEQERMIL